MTPRARAIAVALGWAGLVTAAESIARRRLHSRAQAWLLAYGGLIALAWCAGARLGPRSGRLSPRGLLLASTGYPLGRRLLGDRPSAAPPDALALELIAIEAVAAAEELTWGAIVEPVLGVPATAALFAGKHALIDGRWRRVPGLFAFWLGIAAQRRYWPAAALVVHGILNAAGVIQGHVSGRDRF